MIATRVRREEEYERYQAQCETDPAFRATIYEQNFEACRPSFGDECGYLAACHNAEVNRDPVGSRIYRLKEVHG